MRGIILAGGFGTRLRPLTFVTNKHLLPVYNKPMIEYPIKNLIDFGCDDILIVTGSENVGDFAEYLGDGSKYGVRFTYKVQPEAGGIAQALLLAEQFVRDDELFPVILGDNYFEDPPKLTKPGIIIKKVEDPNRFGVYHNRKIVEKPEVPDSDYAVTGLYWYDYKIFPVLRRLQPSDRGELEITDLNNHILDNNGDVVEYDGYWSDMGTFDSLLEVANMVKQKANTTDNSWMQFGLEL